MTRSPIIAVVASLAVAMAMYLTTHLGARVAADLQRSEVERMK